MATARQKYAARRCLPWLFLLAGLLATGVAWWQGKRLVAQELSAQLDARATDAKTSLERQLNEYAEVLRGYQAQFAARPELTRAAFQRATRSLNLERRLPGIQAIGFSPRVTPLERRGLDSLLRHDDAGEPGTFAAATATDTAATIAATDAFVVRYAEPYAKNRASIGFNQAADTKRRAALYRARDTGELAISERLRLLSTPAVDGVVFFLPLYRGGAVPATLAERREKLSGFVFLTIRIDQMLHQAFGPELLHDLAIRIDERHGPDNDNDAINTNTTAGNPLFDSGIGSREKEADRSPIDRTLQRQLALPVGGAAWNVGVAARPQFARQSQTWLPPMVAMAGALLSLLIFFFMSRLTFARRAANVRAHEIERSLQSQERQLERIMRSIDEVLWTANFPGGAIRYVSPAVERVYGRPASAFYANRRLWLQCIHPDDRARVKAVSRTLGQAGAANIRFRIFRPDGTMRWLRYAVHFTPSDMAGGGRIDSVGRDITEEHLLQESVHRSHRALRAIHECDQKIAAADNENDLLQGICEVAVKAGYRMAWAGLLQPDGSGMSPVNIAGKSQGYIESIRQPLAENPQGLPTIAQALRTWRPAVANDFRQETHLPWRQVALRLGLLAKAALPLIHNDSVLGVLNVYAAEEEAFDTEELGLLEGLTQNVAVALQSLRDQARRKAAEAALHLRQRAIEASVNAIVITSATQRGFPVEYVNPAFERMTGYRAQEIVGQSLRILRRDDHDQPGIAEIRAILAEQREGYATVRNYRKDGTLFWSEVHIAPVRDDAGVVSHFVAAKYDVTEMKHYQEKLEFQASHDALTGLPNRLLLRERLTHAIASASRSGRPFWVAFLDLDHFKFINDSLGHSAGDLLLLQMSRRLQHVLRASDTVAREGGDEFVLILPESNDENPNAHVLQRIMDVIAQPVKIDSHRFYPTCSIGVAAFPTDGADPDTLIKHADIAMYRAKEIGRNNFQFFTAALNQKALERLRLEADLRNAIERNELLLHYQPQVCLQSGRMIGMEALIRWQHPQLGMVAPDRFIGLAEETGLIVPIGKWVMRTACRQNKAWQDAGLGNLRVAVNLSARQFGENDLAQSVAAILQETGLEPRYLDIELTESLVMTDVEHAIGVLRALKALGLQLSIDDFGTGYSSLSYLKRFPLDVLKIDQSFVRDITVNADGAAIVKSIIALAHNLRLHVIAEGVETASQLAYLRENGCDQLQGYYFSRPLAADAFAALLQQDKGLGPEPRLA